MEKLNITTQNICVKSNQNLNAFQIQENKTYERFKRDFGKWFKAMEQAVEFAHYDVRATGHTGIIYLIELKEREYSMFKISGSTYIEETKTKFFTDVHRMFPAYKLLYFNYYLDEGYISFDINSRIDNHSSELLHVFIINLPAKTYGGTYTKNKWVSSLAANPIEYSDKVFVYPHEYTCEQIAQLYHQYYQNNTEVPKYI